MSSSFVAALMPDEAPATDIVIHPLIIMNVSDHATRLEIVKNKRPVIGLLLGLVSSRCIELLTSFEAAVAEDGSLDFDAIMTKRDLITTVFPTYGVVGWYKTGDALHASELTTIHMAIKERFAIESPLVLVMNTQPAQGEIMLPLFVFEVAASYTGAEKDSGSVRRVRYSVESEETERIGIEAATNIASSVSQADRLTRSIQALHMQASLVIQYLKDVRDGTIPRDGVMLRSIAGLCNKLPCGSSSGSALAIAAGKEYEDSLLTVYLGMLSRQQSMLEAVAAKNTVATKAVEPSGLRRARYW
jgi:hypothetical protein